MKKRRYILRIYWHEQKLKLIRKNCFAARKSFVVSLHL